MNIKEIASHLPGKWTVQTNDELVRADGLKLWFREGGYGNENRCAIHFVRRRDSNDMRVSVWEADGGAPIHDPSIKVSATKESSKIAKDIVGRLLVEAERVFLQCESKIANLNKFADERRFAIEHLSAVAGGGLRRSHSDNQLTGEIDLFEAVNVKSFEERGWGRVKVNSKTSIDVHLNSMDLSTATEVVAAIRKILEKGS